LHKTAAEVSSHELSMAKVYIFSGFVILGMNFGIKVL
jgi:hypothetical protein